MIRGVNNSTNAGEKGESKESRGTGAEGLFSAGEVEKVILTVLNSECQESLGAEKESVELALASAILPDSSRFPL